MKKILLYILLAISPIIIYLLWGVLLNGLHKWMIPLTSSSVFIFSYFVFKKTEKKEHLKLGLILSLPFFLLELILSFIPGVIMSLTIIYLILVPTSVYLGCLFTNRKSLLIPLISFFIFAFAGIIVLPNVFVLEYNAGANTNKEFSGLSLVNKNQEKVELDKSKIIVLDFWTTSCGVCFKKFPDFEKYYLEFKDNPNVEFYSVNVPIERDEFTKVVNLVDELKYEFPTLYATSIKEVENLGIRLYPHLLILKDGKIRYSGKLITDENVFVNHIKTEINKLIAK